jgi:nucleoid-associated protein EbfC
MKNIAQLMQQAQAMQEKIAELQAQLDAVEMTGVAGGGVVTVTLNGKGEVKAHAEGEIQKLTGGLQLPGGLKLPF